MPTLSLPARRRPARSRILPTARTCPPISFTMRAWPRSAISLPSLCRARATCQAKRRAGRLFQGADFVVGVAQALGELPGQIAENGDHDVGVLGRERVICY